MKQPTFYCVLRPKIAASDLMILLAMKGGGEEFDRFISAPYGEVFTTSGPAGLICTLFAMLSNVGRNFGNVAGRAEPVTT